MHDDENSCVVAAAQLAARHFASSSPQHSERLLHVVKPVLLSLQIPLHVVWFGGTG
jgi:hypothetical protein